MEKINIFGFVFFSRESLFPSLVWSAMRGVRGADGEENWEVAKVELRIMGGLGSVCGGCMVVRSRNVFKES